MAKKDTPDMPQGNEKPKKKHWWNNVAESYRIAKRTFPLIGWWILAAGVGTFVLFMLYAYFTSAWISGTLLAIGFTLMICMLLLGQLVRKASYRQIAGIPGAAGAVLGQAPRGWIIEQEPVAINPRTKDLVFRCIGRPGVVLVTEGPQSRLSKLVDEQRRKVYRVTPNVPVYVIYTGQAEDQTSLEKLLRTMRKIKKKITNAEVNQVANRLSSVANMNIPVPKGVDPLKARPDRKAMRGK